VHPCECAHPRLVTCNMCDCCLCLLVLLRCLSLPGEQVFYTPCSEENYAMVKQAHPTITRDKKGGVSLAWRSHGGADKAWAIAKSLIGA
jgi:hypothetical protein